MNLSYICTVLYQYNTHNVSGMDISSVDFPSISEVTLSLWVSQIMTSLGPLSDLFFSKLLYVQNFFLPLSQHCHSKKSMSLSVSVSHHSLWGKQAAMSEAALCKWPCDKDRRPPANSQQEAKDCQHPWALVAEPLVSAEPQYDWLLSHLEVWQTPHERSWVKIT